MHVAGADRLEVPHLVQLAIQQCHSRRKWLRRNRNSYQRHCEPKAAAAALKSNTVEILDANAADLAAFAGTSAFRDRLTLTEPRIEAMAKGLRDIAAVPDPLGRTLADWTRPNGLSIRRIATPI